VGFNSSALQCAIGIYGPPGTAKTTIVKKRISKILGRVCVYFLGGAGIPVLDGHSYTYEGSRGKIIQILIDRSV
jgi:ATP-dependent Lon protease